MNNREINKIQKSVLETILEHNKLEGYGRLFKAVFGDEMKDCLKELTPREQKILEMRFGLEDGVAHTLEEVGREFGVTRDRIRQIEGKTLERVEEYFADYFIRENQSYED